MSVQVTSLHAYLASAVRRTQLRDEVMETIHLAGPMTCDEFMVLGEHERPNEVCPAFTSLKHEGWLVETGVVHKTTRGASAMVLRLCEGDPVPWTQPTPSELAELVAGDMEGSLDDVATRLQNLIAAGVLTVGWLKP